MHAVPGVYAEFLAPPVGDDEWTDWYDRNLLANRRQVPGVIAARRTKGVIGSITDFVVYDLENFTIPYGREWAEADSKALESDPPPAPVEAVLATVDRGVYRQILTTIEGPYVPEDTPILHGAYFEVPARNADELNDWYNGEHVPFVQTVAGYRNCRRLQNLENPDRFLALYDVEDIANSHAKQERPENHSPWATRIRAKIPSFSERRVYEIVARA